MSRPKRERRAHKRYPISCPIVVADQQGNELFQSKTINISDGGALFPVPIERTIPLGKSIRLDIRIPRSTPNTFMYEEITSDAQIVRHQPMVDVSQAAAAVKFSKPLNLSLEV